MITSRAWNLVQLRSTINNELQMNIYELMMKLFYYSREFFSKFTIFIIIIRNFFI